MAKKGLAAADKDVIARHVSGDFAPLAGSLAARAATFVVVVVPRPAQVIVDVDVASFFVPGRPASAGTCRRTRGRWRFW